MTDAEYNRDTINRGVWTYGQRVKTDPAYCHPIDGAAIAAWVRDEIDAINADELAEYLRLNGLRH